MIINRHAQMTRVAVGYVADHFRDLDEEDADSVEQTNKFGATQSQFKFKSDSIFSSDDKVSKFGSPSQRAKKGKMELRTILDRMNIPTLDCKVQSGYNRGVVLPELPIQYQSIT